MNPELQRLATELADDPEQRGYANMTPAQVAADLNDPRYIENRERLVTVRTLAGMLGVSKALAVVAAVKTLGTPEANWIAAQLEAVHAEAGVDVSHPETAGYVAALVSGGVITQAEADRVLDLGRTYRSRAQQIGYQSITDQMVMRVREEAQ